MNRKVAAALLLTVSAMGSGLFRANSTASFSHSSVSRTTSSKASAETRPADVIC